jgi:ABC-2 type transport system ATP-binding protein
MRILTGYMPPSEGRATIAGYDVYEHSLEVRKRIGYLPETVPLYKEMSVWHYVDYMAGLHGMRGNEREDRVDEVLDKVGMLDRANSMIDSLSKGMRQRVGLAQALVHRPSVLILDEPTIGLDPRQVREVRELIREVGEERTVLLSTHILSEVSQLCSRILVINKGVIVAEDDPDTLSARLSGSTRFYVRAGNVAADALAEAVRGVKNVLEAHPTERGVEVTSAPDTDVRPQVAAAIVKNKWDLLELKPLGMSMEDIFLQLTTDQESEMAMAEEEAL